ncbi:MAG: hypothetical protein H0T53_06420 [Herpetosiphonaceae bacterium]|nr:hypothetical protein [Herpetosiphonaceae bacterium]
MGTQRIPWASGHPAVANPVERQQEPAVRAYILSVLVAALLWMLGVTLLIPSSTALWMVQAATLVIIGAHLLALRWLRSGHLDAAVLLSAVSLLLIVLTLLALWGLVIAAGLVPALSVSLILVGLVGSRRSLLMTAALSSSGVLLIAMLDMQLMRLPTWLPLMTHPHLFIASLFVLSTGIMLVLLLQFNHRCVRPSRQPSCSSRNWNTPGRC